jgi:hypothetical protein
MTNDVKIVIPHKKVGNPPLHTNFVLLWVPPQDLGRSLITTSMPKEMQLSVHGRKFQ